VYPQINRERLVRAAFTGVDADYTNPLASQKGMFIAEYPPRIQVVNYDEPLELQSIAVKEKAQGWLSKVVLISYNKPDGMF
jgi:hypothetical protein